MNALRRSLIVIVAVAVAFAAGIALGGGPLQGANGGDRTDELTAQNADLRRQVAAQQLSGQVDAAFAQTSSAGIVQGRLAQSPVLLVAMPDVPSDRVEQMRTALTNAGAQVTTTLHLGRDLLDPGRKSYVESVVENAMKQNPGVTAGADSYETLGRLASAAYTATAGAAPSPAETLTRIDGQLTGSNLFTLDQPAQAQAGLVLVLDDGQTGTGQEARARTTIAGQVLSGLLQRANGGVLVGPQASSAPSGVFSAISDSSAGKVSFLNAADSPMAPVLAVLTLVEVRAGTRGKTYGLVDGHAVLPSGLGG